MMPVKPVDRVVGYRLLAQIDLSLESDRQAFEIVLRSYRDIFERCLRLYADVSHLRFGSALKWVKFASYNLVKRTGELRHVPSSLLQQTLFLVWDLVQPYLVDQFSPQSGKYVRRLLLDVDRFLGSPVLPLPFKYVVIDSRTRTVSLPHYSRTVSFAIRPFPDFSLMLDITDSEIYLNPICVVYDSDLDYYYLATPRIRDYDLFGDDDQVVGVGNVMHVVSDPASRLSRKPCELVLFDDND